MLSQTYERILFVTLFLIYNTQVECFWTGIGPSVGYSIRQETLLFSKERRTRKENQEKILDFINDPPTEPTIDTSSLPPGPPSQDPLSSFILTIAKAADKRKAESIRAIRVSKLTAMCSFIVILSGNSRPQNQAICAAIQDDVEEMFGRTVQLEGTADSGWILLDYGDVMVHVMTPRSRLFYDIEGKWKKGEDMDLSEVLVPNEPIGSGEEIGEKDEEDPFWS